MKEMFVVECCYAKYLTDGYSCLIFIDKTTQNRYQK